MEPERQIEKLLRAVAKKRRDQAGDALELRPAARVQLRREISQRAASKSGGGFFRFFSSLFSGFTPKLAFGLCLLAVVGLGVWLLLPLGRKQQPSTLAMNEDSFGKAPAARREIAAPPPASPAPVAAEKNPKSAPAPQISAAASPAPVTGNNASSAPMPQMSLQAEAGANRKHSVAAADTFKPPAGAAGNLAQNSPPPATQAASVPQNAPSALFDTTPPRGSLANAPELDKDATGKTLAVTPPTLATNGVALGATVAAAEPEAQKKLTAPQPQAFFRANQTA